MNRNELLSTVFLVLAVVLLSNFFYYQPGSEAPRIEVTAEVRDADGLEPGYVAGNVSGFVYLNNVTRYSELPEEQRRAFDTALSGGYPIRINANGNVAAEDSAAVELSRKTPVLYNGSFYGSQIQPFNASSYVMNVSAVDTVVLVDYEALSEDERRAFENASGTNASLSAYDYVHRSGSFYAVSDGVEDASFGDVLDEVVAGFDSLPPSARGAVEPALTGDRNIVSSSDVNVNDLPKFVKYGDGYYVVTYTRIQPSVLDVYGVGNAVLTVLGLVFALLGVFFGWKLVSEQT